MPILANAVGYGLRPERMIGGGCYTGAFETFRLGSVATATALARGHLVTVTSAGAFTAVMGTGLTANTGGVIGVLEGVEYIDASGKYVIGTYLPTSTTSTTSGYEKAKLRIITDPNVVYSVMADNTLLKACVSSSGAQISLGAHCSVSTVASFNGSGIFRTAAGLATAIGSLNTIGLKIVGVRDEIIDESLDATTYAASDWVGDILVCINPTVHIATAATGIN
jgi:hypothetical protein